MSSAVFVESTPLRGRWRAILLGWGAASTVIGAAVLVTVGGRPVSRAADLFAAWLFLVGAVFAFVVIAAAGSGGGARAAAAMTACTCAALLGRLGASLSASPVDWTRGATAEWASKSVFLLWMTQWCWVVGRRATELAEWHGRGR
jgi:hypothetical protein